MPNHGGDKNKWQPFHSKTLQEVTLSVLNREIEFAEDMHVAGCCCLSPQAAVSHQGFDSHLHRPWQPPIWNLQSPPSASAWASFKTTSKRLSALLSPSSAQWNLLSFLTPAVPLFLPDAAALVIRLACISSHTYPSCPELCSLCTSEDFTHT